MPEPHPYRWLHTSTEFYAALTHYGWKPAKLAEAHLAAYVESVAPGVARRDARRDCPLNVLEGRHR